MTIIQKVFESAFSQSVLHDLFISTVSGFFLSLLAALLHIRLPNFSVLLFWKSYAKRMTVVPSEVHKATVEPQMRPGERSPLLLYGEVIALGDLLHFFRDQCKSDPPIASVQSTADFGRVKDRNLFLVGGPKYNLAAKHFLQEIAPELYYLPKRLLHSGSMNVPDRGLKVFVGKTADYPTFTYDFQQETQYATIILRKNLYKEGRDVLCAAGLSNTATFAAVDWILNRPVSFWLRVRKQPKGFQAIIKCRVLDQTKVSKLELVFFHELS